MAGAVLAPVVRFAMVQRIEWTPVVMPLAAGASARRDFTVGHSGAYELGVQIDRPADPERSVAAECALGFDFVECEGRTPLRLRWQLRADDGRGIYCGTALADVRVIDARSSGGRFTPGLVERWLGCFDADEDVVYSLQVDGLSGIGELAALHPRFVVLSSATLDRTQHSLTAAVWMLSLFVGLVGILLVTGTKEATETISHRAHGGQRRIEPERAG